MDRYISSGDAFAVPSPQRQKLQAKRLSQQAKKLSTCSSGGSTKRKSLQILQPSATHQKRLVGVDGVIKISGKTKKKSGKRKVTGDGNEGRPRKLSRTTDDPKEDETVNGQGRDISGKCSRVGDKGEKCDQPQQHTFAIYEDPSSTSSDSDQEKKTAKDEAYELMVQEPTPDSYWKQLAEQRREALEDTLKENEDLHDEVANLKADNARLTIMADQAEYLASVVQELMGEEEDGVKHQDDQPPPESTKLEPSHVEEQSEQVKDDEDENSEDTQHKSDSDL